MLPDYNPQNLLNSHSFNKAAKIYMGFFCRIPNSISYEDLEFDRLQEEFPKTFSDLILRENYDKAISKEGTTFSAIYYLPEKIMVEISQREIEFLFCESSPLLTRLLEFVEGFKIELPGAVRRGTRLPRERWST